jgi:flavin reductase (DIM6/NTAB) family NADH-FMN oxidoreductase RutF
LYAIEHALGYPHFGTGYRPLAGIVRRNACRMPTDVRAAQERTIERQENMEEQARSEILKTIPYGFYITGVVGSDGEANGFTTCWVSQVSFEPQQVVVAVRKDQHTHDLIEESGVFSLNFLDTEQEDLARRFTQPLKPEDGAIDGSPYTTGETGAPLFSEAFAHLECRVVGKMEAGDHTVYLGEVAAANLVRPADILTDLDTPMEYGG